MSRLWALLVVAGLLASTAGCLDPYRPHVDAQTLQRASLPWSTSDLPQTSGGPGGAKTVETDYILSSQGSNGAYPAILQVLGVRGVGTSNPDLMRITHQAVENATRSMNIRIDRDEESGTRRLASGLETQFFVLEGTVTSSGLLFSTDAKVRIVGEVGHDGRSATSLVAIGIAQTEATTQCPLPVGCQSSREDLRSWLEMVGDPAGTVTGATSDSGLIHHLVTHA